MNHSNYSGIVFTSSTGFNACTAAFESSDPTFTSRFIKYGPSHQFLHLPCFVVGPATQSSAVSFGFKQVLIPEADDGNAVALAAFITQCRDHDVCHIAQKSTSPPSTTISSAKLPNDWKKPLLIVTSSIRRPTLTTILKDKRIDFEVCCHYWCCLYVFTFDVSWYGSYITVLFCTCHLLHFFILNPSHVM